MSGSAAERFASTFPQRARDDAGRWLEYADACRQAVERSDTLPFADRRERERSLDILRREASWAERGAKTILDIRRGRRS